MTTTTTTFTVTFEFATDAPQENEAVARRRIVEGCEAIAERFAGRLTPGTVRVGLEEFTELDHRWTSASFVQALIDGGGTNIVDEDEDTGPYDENLPRMG